MKKQVGMIIITIVITALVVYFLTPAKVIQVPHSITQADTGKAANEEIAEAIKQRDEMLKENSWLKNALKLSQQQKPIGGAVSNPAVSPIVELNPTLPAKDSSSIRDTTVSVARPMLNPYDFPISCQVTKNRITFLTTNPFLRYYNLPYVKTYEFDRTTSDFEFAITPTRNYPNLDGILLKANERFFSFDGITAGAGAMFPKSFYALLEIKFSMYERLHINPRITSTPYVGAEISYDIVQ